MVKDQGRINREIDEEATTHRKQVARPFAKTTVVPDTLERKASIEQPGAGCGSEKRNQSRQIGIGSESTHKPLDNAGIDQETDASTDSKKQDLAHAPSAFSANLKR